MKTKTLFTGILMFFSIFLSTSASAVPVTMTLETLLADQDEAFHEGGFNVVAPGAHLHATFNLSNFTNAAQMAADTSGMVISKDDAGLFDMISIDAFNVIGADLNPALGKSFAIQFDGLLGGAVQVSKQLTSNTTGIINFLSESILWGGLDKVQVWYASQPTGFGSFSTFTGDDFKFDNIVVEASVSAVPLPAAVWLFFSALGGLGVMRRKQVIA